MSRIDAGLKMNMDLRMNTVEVEKSTNMRKGAAKEECARMTGSNGSPVYDINEPWVQQYIKDFGREPSFFD